MQVCVSHQTFIMRQLLLLAFLVVLCFSCNKKSLESNVVGQWIWTIQYANNPAYNYTPQSTGISEKLSFNSNGSYSTTKNGVIVNSGTYKLSTAKSTRGEDVASIKCTNERVRDSVAYYMLAYNNDSLFFTPDLIGTVGSGSRHYGRQ